MTVIDKVQIKGKSSHYYFILFVYIFHINILKKRKKEDHFVVCINLRVLGAAKVNAANGATDYVLCTTSS